MTKDRRDFDKEASAWDDNPVRARLGRDVGAAIVAQLPLNKEMHVLDFGCGTGLVSLRIAPLVATVTGADSSRGMLGVFQERAEKMGLDNVRTQWVDPDAAPVLTGHYNAIISSMTLHHVEDTLSLLRQFHDCLAPGGMLGLADLDSEGGEFHDDNTGVFHFGFDREALCGLFAEAGFSRMMAGAAAEVVKPDSTGKPRIFSIFLISGIRE